MEIEQTDRDGLAVFRIDGSGLTTASLVFHVGLIDEDFVTAGITHLVEHLVMHRTPRTVANVNATVTPEFTEFWVRGSAPVVAEHLAAVFDAVRSLHESVDAEHLRLERGVLSAEHSGGTPLGIPYVERYGLTGPGLLASGPVALDGIAPEEVVAWVRRFLVCGNAALTVLGPMPEGVDTTLPDGPRHTRSEPELLREVAPMQVVTDLPGVLYGMELPRFPGSSALERIITERLTSHVRTGLGSSYSVQSESLVLDDARAFAVFAVDCAPGRDREVAVAGLSELRRIADQGPDQADLDHDIAAFEELLADPEFGSALLFAAAFGYLQGIEPRLSSDEHLTAMRALTGEQVRDAVRSGLRSLVVAHSGPEPLTEADSGGAELPIAPPCTGPEIQGRALSRRLGRGVPRSARLIYNDDAVALVHEGEWHTIALRDVVGMGTAAEARYLVSRTGCTFYVTPREFRGADQVVAWLDRQVPARLHYRLPD